jgi:peptidyl-prolyl cis-trans isomerase C
MRLPAPVCAAVHVLRHAWLAAALLVLVTGCARESGVLARVGSQTIHTEDFLAAARSVAARYPGPPDSAKLALLRNLVDRELLVQGALRAGLHQDTTFLDLQRRVEQQIIRQRLFEDLGAATVPVSEAEIAAVHRWRSEQSRARIIVTLERRVIEAAHAELERGADFAQVASRFNLAGIAPPGGDLGFVVPGTLQGPLDDAIRTAPVGEVAGPIEVPGQYWFLVRVEERLPRQISPLQSERDQLVAIIQQRKQREILVRALNRLSTAYEVRLERGAGQELVARTQPYAIGGQPPPDLTMAERAQVLVRYRGGVYTLGDAFHDLMAAEAPRPNLNLLPTVERWLELRALERAALVEALRRRYQEEPATLRLVRERLNEYLLEAYVGREVLAKASFSESDVQELLARTTIPVVARLESARFQVVMLPDSAAAAAQLVARTPRSPSLREAVAAAGLRLQVRTENVRYPTEHPLWQPLESVLLATPRGGYGGPLPVAGQWMVFQLLSKSEGRQQGPSPELRIQLEQHALELARARRLAALSDSLRRTIPVAVYPERLRYVAWPALPPGQS